MCLRLLTDPVRIGSPSQTFLEWYGRKSMCARGHGLLQAPEISASYSGKTSVAQLGRFLEGTFLKRRGAAAMMALALRNVSKRFSGVLAVDNVSFSAAREKSPAILVRTARVNPQP